MSAIFEGRDSDSPYIEKVWRGLVERDYSPLCPADPRWNLLFMKRGHWVQVAAEGPTTKSILKNQFEGCEFLVIKFRLGTFMPHLPAGNITDGAAILPEANSKNFWLYGAAWEIPDFDNVETFVERLAHDGLLVSDPVVNAVLQDQLPAISFRTLRRRFANATGLSQGSIRQIERAQQAAALLEQGVPILDVVDQVGYADQPHLTRSLRRYYGQTPAQIARVSQAG
jgi:hypothetical protein